MINNIKRVNNCYIEIIQNEFSIYIINLKQIQFINFFYCDLQFENIKSNLKPYCNIIYNNNNLIFDLIIQRN